MKGKNKMEVRIVRESKKQKDKKVFVWFTHGKELENTQRELQYKKDDVVFVGADSKGVIKIKKYHAYENLMKCLCDNQKDRVNINKSLLINKFTSIFNLDKSYFRNKNEEYILKEVEKNNNVIKESLENKFECLSFKAKLADKLIIGLGGQSVFETDITLHHTYGIPYIPGQAIKGMFRNYIIQEYFKKCSHDCNEDCKNQCEKDAIKHKGFSSIFGGENDEEKSVSGKVIFMDSFPDSDFEIKTDIMTPHHGKYYNGTEQPLDTDEPNPIYFLVVERSKTTDLVFHINIAIDKSISNKKWNEDNGKNIDEFILENLIDALNFHGIGAKTSVGYGYFDIDKEEEKRKRNKEKEEKLKQQGEQEKIREYEKQKKLKEEEKSKKILEEEQKFKEATKNMSEFQIQFYKIDEITDSIKKNEEIIKLYNEKIDLLEELEQNELAEFVRKHLEFSGKWEYKSGKNKKVDKSSERVKKICNILKIEVPDKQFKKNSNLNLK
ncbi:type III-B CRISPR module RAMP protein Cmr6 [Clostridium tagluense]|uniref:type III-B CRISPR module RAMP protein Cmr6 n=1 Tax=Clostridium tagluense TaxID=360422 RepID=UPI001C0E0A78|nr:type III-B CRISPR module RAMP protein Cmr6 [Clostridium tagluense]MBU3127900.1 type III-B CRISPR module RAMP protein Cmr6 [Clostridium tagluense]